MYSYTLSEMSKIKILIIPNAGVAAKELDVSYTDAKVTPENSLAASYTVKHTRTIDHGLCFCIILLKK